MKLSKAFYNPSIVAIDFDDTIAKNGYPDIRQAKLIEGAKQAIKEIKEDLGYRVVLWTCRENKYLEEAKQFLKDNNLYKYFDGFNENVLTEKEYKDTGFKDTRKIGADVYIDDKSVFFYENWRNIVYQLSVLYDKRRE
ncbi:MAG: hypothetical protein ACOCZ5_00565 [bacterium]